MSRQKELDADATNINSTNRIRWTVKNVDGINADGAESVLVWKILEKNKK